MAAAGEEPAAYFSPLWFDLRLRRHSFSPELPLDSLAGFSFLVSDFEVPVVSLALEDLRLSVLYQPEPLKMIPAG